MNNARFCPLMPRVEVNIPCNTRADELQATRHYEHRYLHFAPLTSSGYTFFAKIPSKAGYSSFRSRRTCSSGSSGLATLATLAKG